MAAESDKTYLADSAEFCSTDHLSDDAVVAFVDEVLPRHVQIRVERHIAQCPDCCALVIAQREASETLKAADQVGTPLYLREKLAQIPQEAALLDRIADKEGEEAALQFAQDHGLIVATYITGEPLRLRSELQTLVISLRRSTRDIMRKVADVWRKGIQ